MRDDAQQMVDRILAEARKQGASPQEIATRTEIPYSAVHKFLSGKSRRPTWDTVVLVAQALGMNVQVLGPCRHTVRAVLNGRGDTRCEQCGLLEDRYAPQKQRT